MGLFDIMNDLDDVFNRQIGQAVTSATTLEIWNTSTTTKAQLWLLDESGGDASGTLENAILHVLPGYVPTASSGTPDNPEAFSTWLENNTGAGSVSQWSLAMIMQVQTLIIQGASAGTGNQQEWNGLSGVIGPFNNYINSVMTQDTTIGNTEVQNTQSDIDQLNTAPQAYADAGSSYDQYLSSIANSMANAGP